MGEQNDDTASTVLQRRSVEYAMVTQLRRIAGRVKRRLFPPPVLADHIAKLFRGRSAVLVKVGSNDGVQGDPLRELIQENIQWIVLFIEPIKPYTIG